MWSVAARPTGGETINLVKQVDPFTGNDRYGDVWGEGNFAYIGSFQGSGVGIIDISNPATAFLAAHYNPASGGQFKDVKVQGNIGYFASDNGGGVHIVNLANPATPSLISQVTSSNGGYNNIHNIFVADGFLYEADSQTNVVKVIDVRTPASPSFVRDITTTTNASSFIHDITVLNNRLYTSGFDGKTDIYDVTSIDTTAPTLLGTVDTSVTNGTNNHSNWVSEDGNLLAIAREINDGDVTLWDVSDPNNPVLKSTINQSTLGISAFSPHNPILYKDAVNTFLYVSWYEAGVVILNVDDPVNPVLVGTFDTFPGPVSGGNGNWGVYPFLGAEKILLSDLDGGLFIVDASLVVPEPSTLTLMGLAVGSMFCRRSRQAWGGVRRRVSSLK